MVSVMFYSGIMIVLNYYFISADQLVLIGNLLHTHTNLDVCFFTESILSDDEVDQKTNEKSNVKNYDVERGIKCEDKEKLESVCEESGVTESHGEDVRRGEVVDCQSDVNKTKDNGKSDGMANVITKEGLNETTDVEVKNKLNVEVSDPTNDLTNDEVNSLSASFNELASFASQHASVANKKLHENLAEYDLNTNKKQHITYHDLEELHSLEWDTILKNHAILLFSLETGIEMFCKRLVPVENVSLLVLDQCHLATETSHECHQLMLWMSEQSKQPRLLALTSSVLNTDWDSPDDLVKKIEMLEDVCEATAEIDIESMVSNIYGSKIEEELQVCQNYADKTGLIENLGLKIEATMHFIELCNLSEDMSIEEQQQDIINMSLNVLQECGDILKGLGPWCAGQVAKSLSKQVMKMEENESLEWPKILLQLLLKELCEIYTTVDISHGEEVYDLEGFNHYLR